MTLSLTRLSAAAIASLVGIVAAALLIPATFSVGAYWSSGQWGYFPALLALTVPFMVVWFGSGVLLFAGCALLAAQIGKAAHAALAITHGVTCGLFYNYFLAAMFFDADDFIGRTEEATAWNYALWDWWMYPVLALMGASVSLTAQWSFDRMTNDRKSDV